MYVCEKQNIWSTLGREGVQGMIKKYTHVNLNI